MASGLGSRQAFSRVLSAVVTHKQESLQYLTVDSDTYLQWRTLARNLELTTDLDVASFLLQHYEKTSAIPLTQCVKCAGALMQYCVPCNIYMRQPTATAPLEQESVQGEESVMEGETILIDFTSMEPAQSMTESQQLVMVKADDLSTMEMSEDRGEVMTSNQLEALVEACAMQGAIVTEAPVTVLEPHTTTTTTTMGSKSLLTPEVLRKLKSQSMCLEEGSQATMESASPVVESLVTTAEYQLLSSSPSVTASQLTAPCLPTSSLQPDSVMLPVREASDLPFLPLSLASKNSLHEVTAVVSEECQVSGDCQLSADTAPVVQLSPQQTPETALPEVAASAGSQSADVSGCISVLPKGSLSEDESDYYCAPLFKREEQEDRDLEMAISVLEGKVSTQDGQLAEVSSDAPSIKVIGGADPASTVKQDSTIVDADISDTVHTDLVDSNTVTPAEEESNTPATPHLTDSEAADPEPDTGCGTGAEAEERRPAATGKETTSQSPRVEKLPKSAGRKRKRQSPSPDPNYSTPQTSPQKATTPVVNHTMRTRFYDKKRPSFAPTSTPQKQSPVKTEHSPARGRPGQRAGKESELTQRGKKRGRNEAVSEEEDIDSESDDALDSDEEDERKPGQGRTEQRGRKKRTSTAQGGRKGQRHSLGSRPDPQECTEGKEKKPNLKNQVIVITNQEDLHKLTQPQARLHGQSTCPEIKVKVEGGSGLAAVKTEPDISPLEPAGGALASRVSIVTGGDNGQDYAPPRKRRLYFKKVGKNYACEMCEAEMGSRSELKQHLQQQHGSRPYACSKCPATYKNRSHLRVHLNRHAQVKPFQCPHCPKNFASNYALTAHLTTHSTDRPEVCDVCGRSFKSAKYLKGHKLLHQPGEKRFICQQCGTRFSRKSNLLNHIKIHNNDKQFECPHCHRRFIQSGSLKSHIFRMHNPNRARPYVCEVCGEARYAKDQFEKHMMIHTGTKPYKCEVCGAAFVQSNALKGHMKIHTETEGKAHWCYVCGAAFKKFASLKKHCHKIHSEYPEMTIGTVQVIEVQIQPEENMDITLAETTSD